MVSHPLILKRLEETGHLLEEGTPFYQALTDSKLFTGMEGRLISVGFQSGSADEALNQLSVKYREKAVDLISEAISIYKWNSLTATGKNFYVDSVCYYLYAFSF